ncbi:hypothetical protein SNEBB_001320 [Seison nebaliae]|nr:hypothetical protein SNEBB_001320 [Seison nebaliae]
MKKILNFIFLAILNWEEHGHECRSNTNRNLRSISNPIKIGVLLSSFADRKQAYIPSLALGAILEGLEDIKSSKMRVEVVGEFSEWNVMEETNYTQVKRIQLQETQSFAETSLHERMKWTKSINDCVGAGKSKEEMISNLLRMKSEISQKKKTFHKKRNVIEVIVMNTFHSDTIAPMRAIDQYIMGVNLLVGGINAHAIAPVARFATIVRIPFISLYGGVTELTNGKLTEYSMLTRTTAEYSSYAKALLKVLDKFNWKKVGLIIEDDKSTKSDATYLIARAFYYIKQCHFFNIAAMSPEELLPKLHRQARG